MLSRGDAGQHPIGDVDVAVDQRAPVVAARRERGLHVGVAELGERGLVDLHIAAAGRRERLQLAAEGRDDVVPEFVDVAIGGAVTAASPPRKCSAQGPGMVIFGSARGPRARNAKSSTWIGCFPLRCVLLMRPSAARRARRTRARRRRSAKCRRAGGRSSCDRRRGGIRRRSRAAIRRAPAGATASSMARSSAAVSAA